MSKFSVTICSREYSKYLDVQEHLKSLGELNLGESFKHHKECPICSEYYEKYRKIMDEKHQLEFEARHQFVDIMGSLCS